MSRTVKNTLAAIAALFLCFQNLAPAIAQTSLDAQVSLGTMKVSDKVKVTLVDGSEVTLDNETYPIYHQPEILKVLCNAARWAMPAVVSPIDNSRSIESPVGWFAAR